MDEIDRKIIAQLQRNSRTTFEELSRIIGYSSMGAKKRFDKLIKEGKVSPTAALDTVQFNLQPAIIFLEMENAEAMQHLLERFEQCPRVINIFKTIGGFNLIALVIAEDQDTLESISIERCSLRSSAGIRRSEFYPIGGVEYSPYLLVREDLTHKGLSIAPCNVDCPPCPRYQEQKCGGCPATHYYKGTR
jgi:DNA-binding Lrp family transcriptional regulator